MTAYDPAAYGRAVGDDYDAMYPGDSTETAASITMLAELALSQHPATLLEFGIGTGRLALGVQEHGVVVSGIDGAEHMVEQLRTKRGGDAIDVRIGDYRSTSFPSQTFGVVVLVFNGIFDPRGVETQLDIFRNARQHLVPGGFFVVETWVMNDQQRDGQWSVMPRYVGEEHVELQLARYDLDSNQIERTLVHLRPEGTKFVAVRDTYASPSELDLMATVTGFERVERFSSWNRAPFVSNSDRCVAIYRAIE